MELTELTLWQQILLAALALIGALYVFYFRIWVVIAAGSDLVFVFSLALAVTCVAIPEFFEDATHRLVETTPIPGALRAADARIAEVEDLPARLVERALEQIGQGDPGPTNEAVDESTGLRWRSPLDLRPPVAPPGPREGFHERSDAHPSSTPATNETIASGPFETSVRPAIESLITAVLRATGFITSSLLLLFALGLRSGTSTARALHALESRVAALETGDDGLTPSTSPAPSPAAS